MIIFSLKEDHRSDPGIPDSSFFLKGNENLCFLIHGLTGTPREMHSIALRLNSLGYSVAVPMLADHNQSISVLKRKKWQEIYSSLKNEFLKYEANYSNIFVAGLSFGALLGLQLAYEFPRKIRALNCFSPTLFFDGWSTPKLKILLPLVYRTPLKYYFYFKEEYPYGIKNEKLRSKIAGYYKVARIFDYSKVHLYGYPIIPVSSMYQNYLLAKHVISILNRVSVPVQLLQAKEDDVTSPRNSYYIYNHVASQDKKIVFFEDSYHIITADQERDKVAEAAISFFEKHK
ncbi:MAG: alpha/beta hydrolase [Candidatus Omnitrophota bacterium]